MSVNKAIIIGNVGKDPEIRKTQTGTEIASFSVATSESWKDKQTGERKSKSEWHNISIMSAGLVNIVKQYVKKGSKLYIEGKLVTDKYTDKNGQEKYSTKIVLSGYNCALTLLDSAESNNSNNNNSTPNNNTIDDIPF